jgi:N6-L-threonylcarbamoyladenine synthase
MQMMRILAIETSCDETAFSLIEASGSLSRPTFTVLENLVASQIAIHRPFGGVVPNLAKREHLINLPILFEQIKEKIGKKKIDIVAVTVGPGLEPALWTGIGFAKEIHKKYFPKSKLIGVNHMEGHLYSFLLSEQRKTVNFNFQFSIFNLKSLFPAIALVVSGGHTMIIRMDSLTKRKNLGETRDDAAGEAFDKVARLLGLPYPGGPEIERCAEKGNKKAIEFPRPMMHDKNYEFSFSGLKTSALYYMRDHKTANINDVAASFQEAAIDVLRHKATRAIKEYNAHSLLLSGGVAASRALRAALEERCKELNIQFFAPSIQYNTDNATMIAVAAYINSLQNKNKRLIANGTMSI